MHMAHSSTALRKWKWSSSAGIQR